VLQDLTTIRRLETVRRDFISNISHELRTPLASLRAVVETLQVGALEDPPAARRFLSRAEHEVDTLTQMVEELLELSRIESGRVPFHLSETAVADLVDIPVERFMAQAERDQITLILDLPADLPPVLADADRMQQVVNNLVHNALKFTDEGQVTITAYPGETAPAHVRKQIADLPPSVIIAVKDTGSGIAAEELPRIFERFYKSDRARSRGQGGTGLGLAIARHIVQAHNGRIWAKSKEGKGSTFYFSVPTAC
jgi:two-component system phosphate regulon sensor histidine kinase PhoR